MVIDIPASFIEQAKHIDWSAVREAVKDYSPALTVLRDTWDRETLAQIAEGHLFVRDSVMNEAIAKNLGTGGSIRSIVLRSNANGRLNLTCTTTKKYKKIELSGIIEEFVHDGDKSYAVYRVREKNIPNHGFVSWVFSRVSLSMVERMVNGQTNYVTEVLVTGFQLLESRAQRAMRAHKEGQATLRGHNLMEMIEIEGAEVREGGIMFDMKLNVPDDVRETIRSILQSGGSTGTGEGAEEGGAH